MYEEHIQKVREKDRNLKKFEIQSSYCMKSYVNPNPIRFYINPKVFVTRK